MCRAWFSLLLEVLSLCLTVPESQSIKDNDGMTASQPVTLDTYTKAVLEGDVVSDLGFSKLF